MNALLQLLTRMVEDDVPFYYKGKFWNLSDPKLPLSAGVKFLREQLSALLVAEKEAKDEVPADMESPE